MIQILPLTKIIKKLFFVLVKFLTKPAKIIKKNNDVK